MTKLRLKAQTTPIDQLGVPLTDQHLRPGMVVVVALRFGPAAKDPDIDLKSRPAVLLAERRNGDWLVAPLTTRFGYIDGGHRPQIVDLMSAGISRSGFLWSTRPMVARPGDIRSLLGWVSPTDARVVDATVLDHPPARVWAGRDLFHQWAAWAFDQFDINNPDAWPPYAPADQSPTPPAKEATLTTMTAPTYRAFTATEAAQAMLRLGWTEQAGGSHRKFYPPNGLTAGQRPIVLSNGSGKGDSLCLALLKDLRRFGEPGEQVIAELQPQTPVKRTVAAAPRNGATITRPAVASPAAIDPKAVPDAPPKVDRNFGFPIGGGLRAAVVSISPTIADRYLTLYRGPNRKPLESRVDRYAFDQQTGQWNGLNGETIVFDVDGNLADGQHRLYAAVKSKMPLQALVVWGVQPLVAQRTMDTGASRSLRDLISMAGGKYEAWLANAVANAYKLRQPGKFDQTTKPTPQTLFEFLCDNPQLYTLDEVVYPAGEDRAKHLLGQTPQIGAAAFRWSKALRMNPALLMTLQWYITRTAVDAPFEEVDRFFSSLGRRYDEIDGHRVAFPEGDPRTKLLRFLDVRDTVNGWNAWPTVRKAAYLVKTWNLWRQGREVAVLSWRPSGGESFPVPF